MLSVCLLQSFVGHLAMLAFSVVRGDYLKAPIFPSDMEAG